MITEWLVSLVLGVIGKLLDSLPVAAPFTLELGPAFGMMRTLNAMVPIDAALAAFAVVLMVHGVLFVFGLVRQVWRFVPIVGGG